MRHTAQSPSLNVSNRRSRILAALLIALFCGFAIFSVAPAQAADQSVANAVKQTTADAVDKTTVAVQDAGDKIDQTWRKIDQQSLKNRTRDEIVAWVIVGILVGGVAGMFTPFKNSGVGAVVRFGLGLGGAFIGGIVSHLAQLDFGMGPVLIRYEDLLLALIGSIAIVVIFKLARSASSKGK